MKTIFCFLLAGLLSVGAALGQECTDQWDGYFDTNPLHLKVFSGDTSAGYAVWSYWGDPSLELEIRGEFTKARFMSFESMESRISKSVDAIFDYEIEPEPGSSNPYREGTALDVKDRAFRILATPAKQDGATNVLELSDSRIKHSIMMRMYSPHEGLTLTRRDLPRLFARDRATGKPAKCPKSASYAATLHFPQFLASIYTLIAPFEFKVAGDSAIAGLNKAAGYMYAVSPMEEEEVILARFRAPSFANTQSGKGLFPVGSQVRYWSFCTQNFPNNVTLNCLPDFLSLPDPEGTVYVAIGGNEEVEQRANQLGYSYLPDARGPRQRVMGFVYRNLVPAPDFKENLMYKGPFIPETKQCASENFLSGSCGW